MMQTTEADSGNLDLENHFIYVPSINLWVAKKIIHRNETWDNSHRLLHAQSSRMLTPLEFVEFLRYTRDKVPETYDKIMSVKNLRRAEWLDARFTSRKGGLNLNFRHTYESQILVPKYVEPLDEATLMENRRIDIGNLLNDPTPQGFPKEGVEEGGSLHFWRPYNNNIIRFDVCKDWSGFCCDVNRFHHSSFLGVRPAMQAE